MFLSFLLHSVDIHRELHQKATDSHPYSGADGGEVRGPVSVTNSKGGEGWRPDSSGTGAGLTGEQPHTPATGEFQYNLKADKSCTAFLTYFKKNKNTLA